LRFGKGIARDVAQAVDDAAAQVARRAFERNRFLRRAAARGTRAHGQFGSVHRRRHAAAAQRAQQTFRRARGADRRADVHHGGVPIVRGTRHERGASARVELGVTGQRRMFEPVAGAVRDAADVRVERDVVELEGERAHGRGRIGTDPRQCQQRRTVARQRTAIPLDDRPRQRVQPNRARIVAQAAPQPHRVAGRRSGERREVRKGCNERFVERNHPFDLRLLQHELADHDAVRVARLPPREMRATVHAVPIEQRCGRHPRTTAPMRAIPSSIASRGTGVSDSRM
jgi:hypothetical protein